MIWNDNGVEIGNGSYFRSFAETYVPFAVTIRVAANLGSGGLDSTSSEKRWIIEDFRGKR